MREWDPDEVNHGNWFDKDVQLNLLRGRTLISVISGTAAAAWVGRR